jgi:hypothetical protein
LDTEVAARFRRCGRARACNGAHPAVSSPSCLCHALGRVPSSRA